MTRECWPMAETDGAHGFFNPADRDRPPRIVLLRALDEGVLDDGVPTSLLCGTEEQPAEDDVLAPSGEWQIAEQIGYRDRHKGEIVVPRDPCHFRTDLASVPRIFGWLIGKTGVHLPAALVHDALTPPFYTTDENGIPVPDYCADEGEIPRIEGDRVFRDAMADIGTPRTRRWLIWAGVSAASAWTEHEFLGRAAVLSLVAIALVGWAATLEIFDQLALVPWIPEDTWGVELFSGAVGALLAPFLVGVIWWFKMRLYRAGVILGVAIAALLHLTAAITVVSAGNHVVETWPNVFGEPNQKTKIFGTLGAIALTVLTTWICNGDFGTARSAS